MTFEILALAFRFFPPEFDLDHLMITRLNSLGALGYEKFKILDTQEVKGIICQIVMAM